MPKWNFRKMRRSEQNRDPVEIEFLIVHGRNSDHRYAMLHGLVNGAIAALAYGYIAFFHELTSGCVLHYMKIVWDI